MEWRLLFYLREPTEGEECGWPYRLHHYMFYHKYAVSPRLSTPKISVFGLSVLGLLVGITQLLITVF